MKNYKVTYVLSLIFVVEILLSTMTHSEPSFTTVNNYIEGIDYVNIFPKDALVYNTPFLLILGLSIFSIAFLIFEKLRFRRGREIIKINTADKFDIPILLCIMQVAFLTRLFLLSTQPLQSDEGIYIYTSYLVAKGFIPYRDVLSLIRL